MLTSRVDDVEVVRQLEAGLDAAYRIRAIVETHEAHHPAWERGPARPLAPSLDIKRSSVDPASGPGPDHQSGP